MYRNHDPALGGAPDRTITDHDRGVTISLRKLASRQWRFVVRLAEFEQYGGMRIGETVCEGERSTTRRAESLALELARAFEQQARAMVAATVAERNERDAEWRRRDNEQIERDQHNASVVAATLQRLLHFGDPLRKAGEWRRGDVIETAPFRPGTGKPVSAADLAAFTVIAADRTDPDVYAVCTTHRAIYGTYSQGHARELLSKRDRWCPGCNTMDGISR